MSYFEYSRNQLLELVEAYEDYCFEIGQMYYNQQQEDIDRTWNRVKAILEGLGIPID